MARCMLDRTGNGGLQYIEPRSGVCTGAHADAIDTAHCEFSDAAYKCLTMLCYSRVAGVEGMRQQIITEEQPKTCLRRAMLIWRRCHVWDERIPVLPTCRWHSRHRLLVLFSP